MRYNEGVVLIVNPRAKWSKGPRKYAGAGCHVQRLCVRTDSAQVVEHPVHDFPVASFHSLVPLVLKHWRLLCELFLNNRNIVT